MNKERSNRRRKLPRRIYAFLLVCVMIYTTLSGIHAAEVQVQAAQPTTISGTSWEEVTASDWETLKTYLQNPSHNYKITLSDNIDETPANLFYDIVARIQGNKFLELDAHDITLQANKDDHEEMNYLFEVENGATFFIHDTWDRGTITMHAWIHSARKLSEDNIFRRDIVHVENGGTFHLISGALVAGRSKEQWVTNACALDSGGIMTSAQTYTGNARNQTNGSAVVVEEGGTFHMYGGTVEGRGYASVSKTYVSNSMAAVYNNGGTVNIYNGKLIGRGGAYPIRTYSGPTHIYGGHFEAHTIEQLVMPWDEDKCTADTHLYVYWFVYKDYMVMERKDNYGYPPSMDEIDKNAVVYVSKSKGEEREDLDNDYTKYSAADYKQKSSIGYTVIVRPKNYRSLTLATDNPIYMVDGDDKVTGRVNINKENLPASMVFAFDGVNRYYPETPAIDGLSSFYDDYSGFYNDYEVVWTLCNKAGTELASVTTNTNQLDLMASDAAAIRDAITNGSTYILKGTVRERFGTPKSLISTGGYLGSIVLGATSAGTPVITSDARVSGYYPYKTGYQDILGVYDNDFKTTITASAKNAEGVFWVETNQDGTEIKQILRPGETYDNYTVTFDQTSGTSDLKINNTRGNSYWYARFYNLTSNSYAETRVIEMCYANRLDGEQGSGSGKIPYDVTGIEGGTAHLSLPFSSDDGSCPHVISDEWYFLAGNRTYNYDNPQVQKLDLSPSKYYYDERSGVLHIYHLTPEDAGNYWRKVTVDHPYDIYGNNERYEYVYLSVNDVADSTIMTLNIRGFDGKFIGDPVPTKDELSILSEGSIEDGRCYISEVIWNSTTNAQTLTAQPYVWLGITAKTGYQFPALNSSGTDYLRVYTDGYPYSVEPSNTKTYINKYNTPAETIYVKINWEPPATDQSGYTGGFIEPQDTVTINNFENNEATFYIGQEVNMKLSSSVDCPMGHEGHETQHTRVAKYESITDPEQGFRLPDGLTLDQDGTLHGTVAESNAGHYYCAHILTTIDGSYNTYEIPIRITIKDKALEEQAVVAPHAAHVHTYGAWTQTADGHTRTCAESDCPIEAGRTESEPHDYTEFEVVTRATETVPGTYKATCGVCGYTTTQTYTFEGGDALEVGILEKAITANDGDEVTYNAYANVEENKTSLKWIWETSTDGGKTWTQKSSATNKKNTNSLSMTVTASQDNTQIRCLVESIYGNASSDISVLNVQKIPVTGISLNKSSASVNIGSTVSLTAAIDPSNASNKTVKWSSSNTAVAKVSSSGVVTGIAAGTAKITCKSADNSSVSAVCTITVKQPVTKITLSKTSASVLKGNKLTLTATVAPSNAANKNVTWKSSDTAVATVSSSGVVTAKTVGTATITCTAKDGSGVKATCKVTVKQPVTKITLSKTSASVLKGNKLTLTATVAPSNAADKNVTWKSSDTAVATVSSSGVVTAKTVGTVTITCTAKDGSGVKATCKVTVKQPVTKITLNKTSAKLFISKNLTLKATVAPSSAANKNVTWSSSNSSVATVSSSGVVTAKKAGTATITCKAKDGSGVKATCKITVAKPVTKITLNNTKADLVVGNQLTLKATVNPKDATNRKVTWTSSNTKIATVSSSGVVTAKGAGIVTITCKAADGSGVKEACKITVTAYTPTEQFVVRLYNSCLGRQPDAPGLQHWTEMLTTKQMTPEEVAKKFVHSAEFQAKNLNDTEYVKVLYRVFMGREADASGLEHWISELNRGCTRDNILERFAASQEFKNIQAQFGL